LTSIFSLLLQPLSQAVCSWLVLFNYAEIHLGDKRTYLDLIFLEFISSWLAIIYSCVCVRARALVLPNRCFLNSRVCSGCRHLKGLAKLLLACQTSWCFISWSLTPSMNAQAASIRINVLFAQVDVRTVSHVVYGGGKFLRIFPSMLGLPLRLCMEHLHYVAVTISIFKRWSNLFIHHPSRNIM
jgi:hypothetical protein